MADVDPEKDPALNPDYPKNAPWHANSGQKAVLTTWNGGALATGYGTYGSLLTYGGGHAGYYGSEVYAFDLGTRLWKRVTNPYTGPINFPYSSTTYPDGSPVPSHTYDYTDYHAATNSFVLMRAVQDGFAPGGNTSKAVVHLLDLDTGQWRRSRQNGSLNNNTGGISCYDPNRDSFWALSASGSSNPIMRFDPNPTNPDGTVGAFTNFSSAPIDIDGAAACDPGNDIFVYTQFRYGSDIYAVNLKDPSAGRVKLNQVGDIPPRSSAHGWEWSQKRQAFLYWRRGAGVYEFKLVDGDWKTGTWRWTNLTAASNSLEPQAMTPDNGVYSRFRVANWGGEEVAVVVNRADGPVYAFRVPSGSGTVTPVTVNLSASPRTIQPGEKTTLSWSSANAQGCTASNGWAGSRGTSGNAEVGPLSIATTFVLDCTASNGSTGRASVRVSVGSSATPPANTSPGISGKPATTVLPGSTYSFLPTASDPDGDSLTFSIQNKPDWANFSPTSGMLAGSPSASDVGTTSDIVISATDGTTKVSLPAFSIEVVSQGSYGGTLTWNPPTEDGDGGALVDLAGYNVYIGNQSHNYSKSVRLANPGLTSYSVDGLVSGNWYFAISSFDTAGNESAKSGEIRVALGAPLTGGDSGSGSPATGSGGSPGSGAGAGGSTDGSSAGGDDVSSDASSGGSSGISAMGWPDLMLLGLLLVIVTMRRALRGNAGELTMPNAVRSGFGIGLGLLLALAGPAHADDLDFQARCNAPGVLKCVGFDSNSDAVHGDTLFPAGDGEYHASIDNQVKASGAGSLKFEIDSGSGQNSAGYWLTDYGQSFGENSHFYVQWRQRFSSSMLNTNFGGGGFKQIILHRDGASCAKVQVVIQNVYYRGIPQGYSSCGSNHMDITLPDGDTLLQQGDYQCKRRSLKDEDCAKYVANQWMTFYLDVQVGTFGEPNSRVNFYVGYEGQPLKKFIEINNFTFYYDKGHSDAFRMVQLTPYDTGKPSSLSHPTAYTWYDELIVSSKPIAAPNGTVPSSTEPTADLIAPAPPHSVKFQF